MVFTTLRRITRTGFVNFWRSGFLSFAAVVVMTLSLTVLGTIIFAGAFGRALMADVKDKVDINVYFSLNANESDILAFKADIDSQNEVASTSYISTSTALASFRDKWQDNALIMQGLTEVGGNPFPAALNIKAKDPGQYGSIADYIATKKPTDQNGSPIIEKVNYQENKIIIDRLSRLIPVIERTGMAVAIMLMLVAIVVVFNTIRLIVYTARDEIAVMKLVGASNTYVRGPLVVSGIMYGIVSGLLTLGFIAAAARWTDVILMRLAGVEIASDFSMLINVFWNYFSQNAGQLFLIIMGTGIVLGGVSSYIAARRYLKV